MSKQQHTPGPWFVNEENYEFEAHSGKLSVEAGDYFIAQVDEGLSQSANARLIAAAPELLEALKAFRDSVPDNRHAEIAGCDPYHIEPEVLAKIDAAIAKARGEV